jgi:hypothetical protein
VIEKRSYKVDLVLPLHKHDLRPVDAYCHQRISMSAVSASASVSSS